MSLEQKIRDEVKRHNLKNPDARLRTRLKIIEELALIVFKKDSNGNLLTNEKGSPKIDWISTATNLVTILAKIFILYRMNFPLRIGRR